MKYLIILLVFISFSCENPKVFHEADPSKTTLEIVNNADTMLVSVVNETVYLLNEDKVVISSTRPEDIQLYFLFMFVVFSLGILVVYLMID